MKTSKIEASRSGQTFLESEEAAYPNGGMTRRGRAIFADGKVRRVWAGIPDTFFTIPARARPNGRRVTGFLSLKDGELHFTETQKGG